MKGSQGSSTGRGIIKDAREAALRALVRFERDGAYLNLALPPLLSGLDARERALVVKLAGGTVQRLNTIDWAIELYSRRPLETYTPWIRNILRLGAFQIIYLESIPGYAAVNSSVQLGRRHGHRGVAGLINAVLRKIEANRDKLPWPEPSERPLEYLSLIHSLPPWMVKRALERFGFDEAEKWCLSCNHRAPVAFRPNTLRTNPTELAAILHREEIETAPGRYHPGMLQQTAGRAPAQVSAFKSGLFTIQGESSAFVVPLLKVNPGDVVLDLCSAPGGKTTHLAELMEDRGTVFAVEKNRARLGLVTKAAERLGLKSIEPVLADGRQVHTLGLPAPAAILVDAPCSGLGVTGRLPEIKWRRDEKNLQQNQKLQLELLHAAARILSPGGTLLYSVCTNEPEETDHVKKQFEHHHPSFKPNTGDGSPFGQTGVQTGDGSLFEEPGNSVNFIDGIARIGSPGNTGDGSPFGEDGLDFSASDETGKVATPGRTENRHLFELPFKLEHGAISILPHRYDLDGFYIVSWRKDR